jgi:hypothetical protein
VFILGIATRYNGYNNASHGRCVAVTISGCWIAVTICVSGACHNILGYLQKKGINISQTSAYKLNFHSAKLKIKRSNPDDLLEYNVIQGQHKSCGQIVKHRNIIPYFPTLDLVRLFALSFSMNI